MRKVYVYAIEIVSKEPVEDLEPLLEALRPRLGPHQMVSVVDEHPSEERAEDYCVEEWFDE